MTLFAQKLFAGFLALLVATSVTFAQARPAYTQPELDQMLAPIALYPDALLSQILMASTYPIEVAEAARWSRANPGLQGDAAVQMAQDRDWDPSVKSLVAFPNVLARMAENPEWTRALGDAFIAQEPQVMETVQALRRRAHAAGQLASDDRVRVIEQAQTIEIVPAHPQTIYVPYYDPWIAYGPWWWPAYPPVVWAPWPGYVRAYRPGFSVGFWWGAPVGISAGFFFGGVDWPRRHVRIVHVDNYYVRPVVVNRRFVVAPGRWQHDPWHRRGVAYRDPALSRRFSAPAPSAPAPLREQRRDEAPRRSVAPSTATPLSNAPRFDAPRPETRTDGQRREVQRPQAPRSEANRVENRPEPRRREARPLATSPQGAEPMPAARAERTPAQHIERNPTPRAERTPPPRFEQSPAAHANRTPAPRVEQNRQPRGEHKERRDDARGEREQHAPRDKQVQNR